MSYLATAQCGDCDWTGPEDQWEGHDCSYKG